MIREEWDITTGQIPEAIIYDKSQQRPQFNLQYRESHIKVSRSI